MMVENLIKHTIDNNGDFSISGGGSLFEFTYKAARIHFEPSLLDGGLGSIHKFYVKDFDVMPVILGTPTVASDLRKLRKVLNDKCKQTLEFACSEICHTDGHSEK